MRKRNKHLRQPKGPSKMPSGYEGMKGWTYHPRKGFSRLAHFEPSA